MRLHFALDFDGTICPVDTTDLLLERFADPAWEDVEAEWQAGRITSRACLARQVDLLRATPEQIAATVRELPLDPAFIPFVTHAWLRGAGVSIVSDGFDQSIVPLLHANGIDLPLSCNRLIHLGADRWAAAFSADGALCGSGTCKCAVVPKDRTVVLVGDGRSDFCLARRADYVLAKGRLADFCRDEGIPHQRISGFADALPFIAAQGQFTRSPAPVLNTRHLESLHA